MSEPKIYTKEEFGEIHHTCIGSSAIAALLGVSKWSTALSVWGLMTGKTKPQKETNAMWLGHEIEPVLGSFFSRMTGKTAISNRLTYHSKKNSRFIATPDFIIDEAAILEVKNVSGFLKSDWEEGPPDHVRAQCIWQMGILREYDEFKDLELCHVGALIGGNGADFKIYEVNFSQGLFNTMVELAETFLFKFVDKNVPPEVTVEDSETIAELFPETTIEGIDLSANEAAQTMLATYRSNAEQLSKANKDAARVKDLMKLTENQFRMMMAGHAKATIGHHEIEFKTITKKAYQVKESSYTKFTIKEIEENGTAEHE